MTTKQGGFIAQGYALALNRDMPDIHQLIPEVPTIANAGNNMMNSNGTLPDQHSVNYESSVDLNQITRRQLEEDILAYRYDLDSCRHHLAAPDLTPQEARTVQLRVLDMGHQIRHCQHRLEMIDAQVRQSALSASTSSASKRQQMFSFDPAPKRQSAEMQQSGGGSNSVKRPRLSSKPSHKQLPPVVGSSHNGLAHSDDTNEDSIEVDIAPAFFNGAGSARCSASASGSAACWPLKDISKMLNHFLDMHTEHTAEERCMELGDALDQNRGPFEYWLTRTRRQDLRDGTFVDDCVGALQNGSLPDSLRSLNRAAADFPNSIVYTKSEDPADM
ncbi:hypothetical protein PG993_000437 [Apiospora rasikravindrae]|uniref:Uncharacterized protein n=1 Tax=Apiospora rasikravindrae TaxID=990691 RepID=A0ABR1U8K3_9PEZI